MAGAAPHGPFFAWVHLFDPHAPYEPPAPYAARFAQSPYDGEVAYADAQLGRLLALARPRGPAAAARWWSSTSDHGEGLGEHGEDEHMFFVYDSTLRVPLVLLLAGPPPRGRAGAGQFRSIDLMPTLLDLAGVPAASRERRLACRAPAPGGRIPDNESYAESLYAQLHFGYAPLRALRGEGWKYIDVAAAGAATGSPRIRARRATSLDVRARRWRP